MRLSDHIKNIKTAPAPLPARPPAAPGAQPRLSERSGRAGNAIPTSSRLQEVGIGIAGGPATTAQKAPGAAAAPAYFAPTLREVGATKAGSKITPFSSPPPAKKELFRLSDLIMKKQAAPAPAPVPAPVPELVPEITSFSSPPPANKNLSRLSDLIIKKRAESVPEPVPKPAPMPKPAPVVEHTPAPAPEPVPVMEHAPEPLPASMDASGPARNALPTYNVSRSDLPAPPDLSESRDRRVGAALPALPAGAGRHSDAPGPDKKVFDLAPARPPAAPAHSATRSVAGGQLLRAGNVAAPLAPLAERPAGGPAKDSAALEKTANASRYEESPVGIYEICRQFGIAMPDDGTVVLKQVQACLRAVFKKIMLPAAENYMIWPMIKSIASDIEGIITVDTTVLNILHSHRVDEEKLIWHSIYTAILAIDLARHAEHIDSSVLEIGGAALLHDAGFLIQTAGNGFDTDGFDKIADKKSPEFREHVGQSVKLANRIEAPDAVVTMIAQHQGRLDGQGFPPGLSHSTFMRCSQVLAIADIFEHAVIDVSMEKKEAAPGNAGENSENGLAKVFRDYRKAFDIDLLKNMIALVGFYPVDSMVELNNRTICKVVKQNDNFPLRPVVQVVMDGTGMHPEQEKLIDLKDIKVLSIMRTLASSARKTEPIIR